ncbi:hypothetical protein EVAR_32686_1 [Eumeta japonica]|uniref:Uncharacterized protein n=1 Tax=Eumeta variegata TaxID=151549 RepID=A0A4C1VPQ7_EUMVA|nr:hypothetical protein EVAR_32686_1 [Eumeta japonica]
MARDSTIRSVTESPPYFKQRGFSVVAPEVAVPGKTTAVLVTLHGSAEEEASPLNVTVRLETQDAENDVKLLTTASRMISVESNQIARSVFETTPNRCCREPSSLSAGVQASKSKLVNL